METIILWRPTGEDELNLIARSNFKAYPAPREDQTIFYPVLTYEYAAKLARDWHAKYFGKGYVTQFNVKKSFLDNYDIHQIEGKNILEYWIPAEELNTLNENIVGPIEIIEEFIDKE